MRYNIDFEVCSLLFLFMLLLYFLSKKHIESFQSKQFRLYMIVGIIDIMLNILSCTIEEYAPPVSLMLLVNLAFLVVHMCVPYICTEYVLMMLRGGSLPVKNKLIFSIPFAFIEILILSSPFSDMIFYCDSTGYHHGPYHILTYATMGLYLVVAVVEIIIRRKNVENISLAFLIFIISVSSGVAGIQAFFSDVLLSGLGISLSVFLMYFTIEDPAVFIDPLTESMNRSGFMKLTGEFRKEERPYSLLVVALDNFKILNEVFGVEGGDVILKLLVNELHKRYPQGRVFRYNGDTFCIVVNKDIECTKEAGEIKKIIHKNWMINGVAVDLSACICIVYADKCAESDTDLIKAIDYSLKSAKQMGKGQMFVYDDAASEDMVRGAAIEQAMLNAIESRSFEVHYQPIYDTVSHSIHSLEALARLNVPEYGYVSPEEFIRIAEQNGMIIEIGNLVLDEVCKFIIDGKLEEKGIEFVEVNLSVVQCMQENYHQIVVDILKKRGVSPKMVNLEITETAAAYSEDILVRNMARMRLADLEFSMDDYGSGYSNINYIVKMPFSIIKIDKIFVWSAFKKGKMRRILENTVSMFHDINMRVVAEGVEDKEMADTLATMGVEYLQGFYYSKPLPPGRLLEFLDDFKSEHIEEAGFAGRRKKKK